MLNRHGRGPSPFIIPPLFRPAVLLFLVLVFRHPIFELQRDQMFHCAQREKIFPQLTSCLFDRHFSGIANRAIRPTLGIVDPLHTLHMPERLTANSGYDVLW